MKAMFSFLAACLLLSAISAQDMSPRCQMAMGKTLSKYGQCQTVSDWSALSANFDRIAKRDSSEWLPKYYAVHTLVIASFTATDPIQKDDLLDQADASLDALLETQAKHAEVHVLHAMYYTARLVVDPAGRGQKYSILSGQAVSKAKALDPSNPRVQYMDIANGMGTAQFFGQDVSTFCAAAKQAHDAFDSYPQASRIHPGWGKDLLAQQAATCER